MKTARLDPSFVPIPFIIAAPLVTDIIWRLAQIKEAGRNLCKKEAIRSRY